MTPEHSGGSPAADSSQNDTQDDPSASFAADALAGLMADPKTLPCKYLYDERGSELFDRICETKDYYPTRTEIGILRRALPEVSERVGPGEIVIEPGAGSGQKTVMLIEALDEPSAIVPIDISPDYVDASCEALRHRFPRVSVEGVVADFTEPVTLPDVACDEDRRLVFFPGSTIGNFDPLERRRLLSTFGEIAGHGGRLLLGFDLVKDRETLLRAYDDDEGVTADFNLNLVDRMRRELDADLPSDAFEHESRWNEELKRIEMHLVARDDHSICVDGETIPVSRGETIHTESSHKFEIDAMIDELTSHGFDAEQNWTDTGENFAVVLLRHVG
jgi:L-histidine N-alpha-methyltransferase